MTSKRMYDGGVDGPEGFLGFSQSLNLHAPTLEQMLKEAEEKQTRKNGRTVQSHFKRYFGGNRHTVLYDRAVAYALQYIQGFKGMMKRHQEEVRKRKARVHPYETKDGEQFRQLFQAVPTFGRAYGHVMRETYYPLFQNRGLYDLRSYFPRRPSYPHVRAQLD